MGPSLLAADDMREHNVGVLISPASARSEGADNDSQIDRESGGDLAEALGRLGLSAISLTADDALDLTLRRTRPRACVLATHGEVGGLGRIQSLLELRKIPYAGPTAQATSLAYDKLRARQILAYHSLPVPTTIALGGAEPPTRQAVGLLGWPCVLKPRRGSHAAGVRLLPDAAAVADAIDAAGPEGGEFLLERAVLGREIQIVLMHGRALGAMEVERDLTDTGPAPSGPGSLATTSPEPSRRGAGRCQSRSHSADRGWRSASSCRSAAQRPAPQVSRPRPERPPGTRSALRR